MIHKVVISLEIEDARAAVLALYAAVRAAGTIREERRLKNIAAEIEAGIIEVTRPEPPGQGDPLPPPPPEKVAGIPATGSGL